MKITVTALRRKYPHPRRPEQDTQCTDSYCVGGALVKEMGEDYLFPDCGRIAAALRKANPDLIMHPKLYEQAELIEKTNDAGEFKRSWKILGQMLRWKPSRKQELEWMRGLEDSVKETESEMKSLGLQ